LKFAIPEARQVGALFAPASEVIVGSRATETVFKATAGQYQIIHLATHGFFNRTNPLFSGLELEPDQSNDGRLEVYEVMTLHLNARLVTLSACDTALGSGDYSDVPAGDEFVGLSRAFLEAGSDAVLASLWKVNDRSTLVMMSRIYHAMKTHDGPQSLALAQRSMIRNPKYGHPFYWAPFVYVGGEFNHSMAVAEKP
jgi:CHAT domain-containing protein